MRRLIPACLICGIAVTATAAPLRLEEAIARAREQNPTLAARRYAADASCWELRQARAQLLPSVSLDSRYTRLDDETVSRANVFGDGMWVWVPDSLNNPVPVWIEIPRSVFRDGYETSISGSVALLNPSAWNAVSFASSSRRLAGADLIDTTEEVVYQTLRGFVDLLKTDSMIRIQERLVEQARGNREQAERLFRVGRYAEADVLRWRVEEVRQQQLLIQQASARRVSALALENLMGDPPRGSTMADTLLPPPLAREIERFRAMGDSDWEVFAGEELDRIISANPRLAWLEESVRAAEIRHRQSLLTFLPNVAMTGSYGWQTNDTIALDGDKAWSVSAIFSMPLFTSLANVSGREASKYQLRQARATRDAGERDILLAAEAARTSIRSFAEQLRLAETSLSSARRSYEIRRNSFDLGRLNNLEWIDALLALRSAEQSRTSAYYDLVLAVADYARARGRIEALIEEK